MIYEEVIDQTLVDVFEEEIANEQKLLNKNFQQEYAGYVVDRAYHYEDRLEMR